MKRSASSRSTDRPHRELLRRGAGADVYLLPAPVGRGRGDIEEVLTVARDLHAAGYRLRVYRPAGRRWPRELEGAFDWPPHERFDRLLPVARRAVTISSSWGITAGPSAPGPLGAPGPWTSERQDIEETYGTSATLHVSLEEFARTLSSEQQTVERYREAGRPLRWIREHLRTAAGRHEVIEFHRAYRRFRRFATSNVLHLYPSFLPSRRFAREFPEAIQTGPLEDPRRRTLRWVPIPRNRREWLWYASPGSSERLAPLLWKAVRGAEPPVRIAIRSPHRWAMPTDPAWTSLPPLTPREWERRFRKAEVRIVTGSRSLLEALAVGGPFLYFNGVTGSGRATRAHRPEKIRSLLEMWRRAGVGARYRRALSDFARLRAVEAIVRRAATEPEWIRQFPKGPRSLGFPPPYRSPEELLRTAIPRFAQAGEESGPLVAEVRSENRRALA